VKEFLDNLYKQCSSSRADGIDEIYGVVGTLLVQRKFEVVNSILRDMDLAKVHISTMYALIHMTSPYIYQLPNYRTTYQKCREEFARRGETSEEIDDHFNKYKDGWQDRLFDPNAPPNKNYHESQDAKFNAVMDKAQKLGDKDIIDYLTYYQAYSLQFRDRDRKFRNLRSIIGEEEMRTRCVQSLREMADKLESTTSCWPGIYYCDLPEDPLLKGTFIGGIEVVISYPWPG
jgi:hypothetical protein